METRGIDRGPVLTLHFAGEESRGQEGAQVGAGPGPESENRRILVGPSPKTCV